MSDNYAISLKRSTALAAAITFTAMLTVVNFASIFSSKVGAAQLQARSLEMTSTLIGTSNTGAANSATNGADATHNFKFTAPTADDVLGIAFLYCTTAIGTCTAPTGLVVNSTPAVTVQTDDGGAFTNSFTFNSGASTANRAVFSNVTGQTVGAGSEIEFAFDDVTNPTPVGSFFVRITTHDSAATFDNTTDIDEGTVAGSTTTGISITSRVVETLGFSTTGDTSDTGIPVAGGSCTPLTGSGAIQLGDPTDNTLSISQTFDAYSALRLYTNASLGAVVQYSGETLTKGSDNIDAIGGAAEATTSPNIGTEQFGLAIAQTGNSETFTGFDNITTAWDEYPTNTAGQLSLAPAYATGDGDIGTETVGTDAEFAFVPGNTPQTIAQSDSYVECATAAVRYASNISALTPSGTYTTTVVYHAVPQY